MAGIEPGLWSVDGGNKRVPEELIKHAQINVIKAEVNNVALTKSQQFVVTSRTASEQRSLTYDIVVMAMPLSSGHRHMFSGFPREIITFDTAYQQRYAYFFKGLPHAQYFGFDNANQVPNAVLTCQKSLKLTSMGEHVPVDYVSADDDSNKKVYPSVYKIFTNEKLTGDEIKSVFPSYDDMRVVDWPAAYPIYRTNDTEPPFELFPNLYYVNAIEWAASAMEMSAIGGRNVALLAHARWRKDDSKVDQSNALNSMYREEL